MSLGAEGTDAAGALVSVQADGSVIVTSGLTDMGQGVGTALALIAAAVLGIDPTRIATFNVHTGRVPDSGPTVASRSTLMGGQAVRRAAESVGLLGSAMGTDPRGFSLPADVPARDQLVELPFKDAKEEWINSFEKDYILELLRRHNGNISQASREADIDRKYFRKLMAKHGIESDDL